MREHEEKDWLIPASVLTAAAGIAAFALMVVSGFRGTPPFVELVPKWLLWAGLCLAAALAVRVVGMLVAGQDRPTAKLRELGRRHWRKIAVAYLGAGLAGVNLVTYMWLKPQLDYVAPFWMDPLLADADAAILGDDGWRLLEALNNELVATTYTTLWFMALVPALLYIFLLPPSRNRTAAIVSYFLLWSLFGPVGQYLMSAAGPVFYQRLGLGLRYADIQPTDWVALLSGRLWWAYTNKQLVTGAGISAMPSLHIATVAWATIALAGLRSRLTPLAAAFALYMWVASVALGWHYMVDGLVGALMAGAAFLLARMLTRPYRRVQVSQPLAT